MFSTKKEKIIWNFSIPDEVKEVLTCNYGINLVGALARWKWWNDWQLNCVYMWIERLKPINDDFWKPLITIILSLITLTLN